MKAFVVATALLAIATGAQAAIKCKTAANAAGEACAADVKFCKMTSTYAEDTFTTVSGSAAYECAPNTVTTLMDCAKDTSAKTNTCYCTGNDATACQDVTKCHCDTNKYANINEGTTTTAEPGSASSARIAGVTMAAAAAAWWLL